VLPEGIPAVPEYYDMQQYWPAESLARAALLLPRIRAHAEASSESDSEKATESPPD
jgi:hypothetical protein